MGAVFSAYKSFIKPTKTNIEAIKLKTNKTSKPNLKNVDPSYSLSNINEVIYIPNFQK